MTWVGSHIAQIWHRKYQAWIFKAQIVNQSTKVSRNERLYWGKNWKIVNRLFFQNGFNEKKIFHWNQLYYGIVLPKSAVPSSFNFVRVKALLQSHVKSTSFNCATMKFFICHHATTSCLVSFKLNAHAFGFLIIK